MKIKPKLNKLATKLTKLKKSGVRRVKTFYIRKVKVNGKFKNIPNYRTMALTGGVIAAAAAGTYVAHRRHKKHGHVLYKKKK